MYSIEKRRTTYPSPYLSRPINIWHMTYALKTWPLQQNMPLYCILWIFLVCYKLLGFVQLHFQTCPHDFTNFYSYFLRIMINKYKSLHLWIQAILLYFRCNQCHLTNHKPIVLADTIYKLFTRTFTSVLYTYGERHQILANKQYTFFELNNAHHTNHKLWSW